MPVHSILSAHSSTLAMSDTTTIAWKGDPDYRGTFNIMSACLSTLLICVWTAIHDDITKGRRWHEVVLRKMCWFLVGLLAPECILYITFCQYMAAKGLLDKAIRTGDFQPVAPWYRQLIARCKDAWRSIKDMVRMQ